MLGTSGSALARVLEVTASGRNLPSWMNASADGAVGNDSGTRLLMTSSIAWSLPL
jgi:hypothetical protein